MMAAEKQPKNHLFILLFGVLANAIVGGMAQFLQIYAYANPPDGFGLSKLDIGIIWGISSVFGAISNIFWGAVSDKTHTRWGKRKPYMILLAPLAGLFIWVSASVNILFGFNLIFWNFLIYLTIKNVIHAGASVPYTTVIPEVVPPEKRVVVSQLSAVVNGVGMGASAALYTMIYDATLNFQLPFLIVGIFLVFMYYISAVVIPKEKYRVVPVSIYHAFRTTFKDRNYMLFQIGQFLWSLALNIVLFMLPFLATDLLGADLGTYGWLFISFLAIAGVFLFVINFAVEKLHIQKKKALMFSLIFTTIALPFFGLIGSEMLGFLDVLAQAYLIGSVLFIGLIGIFIFPYAIMMALINYDKGTEATYNGVNGFIIGLAAIPSGPVGAVILEFLGYPITGVLCSILIFISILFMARVQLPEHLFQKKMGQENTKRKEEIPIVRKDDHDSPALI